MKNKIFTLLLCSGMLLSSSFSNANTKVANFKMLVLTERGGGHEAFVAAALEWLQGYALAQNFEFKVINDTKLIDESFLSGYKVFVQLNYPPYAWTDKAKSAFEKYIENGNGGWVGFHHATLLGEFDGYAMWKWYSGFMGGIRFKNYIAARATAQVRIEDRTHPVMKGLPETFTLPDDEWYTFDKSPRVNVKVLANVDESSYQPPSEVKMGDHPVIWSNEKMKSRNVYFLFGHHANLLKTQEFKILFANAILWASGKG